jgi:hypothetical protein
MRPIAAACLAISGTVLAGPADSTLIVAPDQVVRGEINDQAVRYRVLADGTSTLLLNSEAVSRLGIKPGLIGIGVRIRIGSTVIDGRTASIRYTVDAQTAKRRIAWFSRPVTSDVDGVLGPAAVPQSVVTFQLHESGPDERVFTLPLVDRGYQGMGTVVAAGTAQVFVQWDLARAGSMATAAAAADFAVSNGAVFSGPGGQEVIRFGVERPVRRLLLGTPVMVGPLRIDELGARTGDYGDASRIPDRDADASEVVVTVKGHRDPAIHQILIGRDAMAPCSQISFDKARARVVLRCQAP